jgi:hypothetical protein
MVTVCLVLQIPEEQEEEAVLALPAVLPEAAGMVDQDSSSSNTQTHTQQLSVLV